MLTNDLNAGRAPAPAARIEIRLWVQLAMESSERHSRPWKKRPVAN